MRVFLTGFPGFLGAALTERLLARGESVTCLVQPAYEEQARERAEAIRAALSDRDAAAADDHEAAPGALSIVTGDITEPELGLDDPEAVRGAADSCYHLAAIYDLGVDRPTAEAVNVRGTERVLDFAEAADVDRFHYVSTCYVSGRHPGVFGPEDLDVGQSFNNHYEATKFEAEVAVQERRNGGLPTTIYRPAIVTGDSETGATEKYDGLYYMLGLIERQSPIAFAPVHPPSRRYEFNVVPRDFVLDAITELSGRADTVDEVYQLCNPNPPTVQELVRLCGRALDRRVIRVPVHARATGRLLGAMPGVAERFEIKPASMDYLAHPTRYVGPNTAAALAETPIDCPPLSTYIDGLAAYMQANPELRRSAMA